MALQRENAVHRIVRDVHDFDLAAAEKRVFPRLEDFAGIRIEVIQHFTAVDSPAFVDLLDARGADAECLETPVVLFLRHHRPGFAREREQAVLLRDVGAQFEHRHEIRLRIVEIEPRILRDPHGPSIRHAKA